MTDDPQRPEVLISVPNGFEAAAIVGALVGHGIRAHTVGDFTAGFQAEAPGEVRVVVAHSDYARAKAVLEEIRGEPDEQAEPGEQEA